ncbi:MAG TPA: IS1595 family transposase [Tepidisphaeraceae bacterium]|nr:IS1595 family transposase [Tepidisphaeraceae bacterium]
MKHLKYYASMSEDVARYMLEQIRWPNGPVCPHCGVSNAKKLEGDSTRPGVYKCKDCRKQFTVTVGTVFERSHIPLSKWVLAFYMMVSSKKGVSALQLQNNLGLGSYETAWHMAHRLRLMMKTEQFASKLGGVVEVDETYVGGKPRPKAGMPRSKRGRGTNKTPVFVMVERNGDVRTKVVHNVQAGTLQPIIRQNVDRDAIVNSDEWKAYIGLDEYFAQHNVVRHKIKQYVNGDAHTNTAESFNALLKRGHKGVFHYMSKKHLHRYCDEFTFRWNNRKEDIEKTIENGLSQADGKTLTYNRLIA